MAGLEILSPEGLRLDGRRPHELRKIVCRMGVFKQADGSAYIEMGNTKALATVYGPHEVTNKSKILHDRVLLNCQFSMATFSTGERKKRPKGDRKSTETSMLIRRTFDAAILTQMYPRSQIDIYVQVSRIFYIRLERVYFKFLVISCGATRRLCAFWLLANPSPLPPSVIIELGKFLGENDPRSLNCFLALPPVFFVPLSLFICTYLLQKYHKSIYSGTSI